MEEDFSTRLQINRQKIMKRHRNLKFEANLDYTVRLVRKPRVEMDQYSPSIEGMDQCTLQASPSLCTTLTENQILPLGSKLGSCMIRWVLYPLAV